MVRTVSEVVEQMKEKYPLPTLDHNWSMIKDDPDFFDTAMEAIAKGHSAANFAESIGLQATRVQSWLARLKGEQAEQYAQARAARAGYFADEIVAVLERLKAGDILVPQARMMVDTLKWMAERLDPHIWGNKLQIKAEVKTTTEMHLEGVMALAQKIKRGDDSPVIEGEVEPQLLPRSDREILGDDPKPKPKRKPPQRTREEIREEILNRPSWTARMTEELLS